MATRDPLDLGNLVGNLGLGAALAGIEPPNAAGVEITAGFFHRTLARWLGLPEGRQPSRKKDAAPLWDYDFWKAELVDDGFVNERHVYTAKVYRADSTQTPEVYRYWVRVDSAGRIRASGWLTDAPDLVSSGSKFAPGDVEKIAARDLRRVFADD